MSTSFDTLIQFACSFIYLFLFKITKLMAGTSNIARNAMTTTAAIVPDDVPLSPRLEAPFPSSSAAPCDLVNR